MSKANILKIRNIWDNEEQTKGNSSKLKKFNYDEFIGSIFCPGPFYFYVLNFTNRSFDYVSPLVKEVLGANPEEITLDQLLARVHPDDIEHMVACEKMASDFLFRKIIPAQLLKYKVSYSYRLRHNDGSYKHILSQAIAISKDDEGKLLQVSGVHSDISHITNENDKRMSFIGIDGEPSYMSLKTGIDVMKLQPITKTKFSVRELQLIQLFSEGLSAAETANELNISVETVRTHRKNILAKTNCKNITELVVKCLREELI